MSSLGAAEKSLPDTRLLSCCLFPSIRCFLDLLCFTLEDSVITPPGVGQVVLPMPIPLVNTQDRMYRHSWSFWVSLFSIAAKPIGQGPAMDCEVLL